jgi:hypothetical protein
MARRVPEILYNAKMFKLDTSVDAMNILGEAELHIEMAYQPSLSVFPLDGHGKNSSATTRGYWLCNDNDCFIASIAYFRSQIGKLSFFLKKNKSPPTKGSLAQHTWLNVWISMLEFVYFSTICRTSITVS